MTEVLGGIKVNNIIWMSTSLTLGSLFICVLFIYNFSGTVLISKILQLYKLHSNIHIQSYLELV